MPHVNWFTNKTSFHQVNCRWYFYYLFVDLPDLKEYITEAEEKRFPDSELMQQLVMAVSEAEKCANVAAQLVSKKARTRSVDPHGPSTKGGGGRVRVGKDITNKKDVLLIANVRKN